MDEIELGAGRQNDVAGQGQCALQDQNHVSCHAGSTISDA